ncbi:hypothetical protein PR202_ga13315 [Eleusine coracana subsp. coracana]|uniref:FHA domain-containing protein n=1 Tax=Eleusine coracana subsp. coracana TaxID=191504 RepID=A0AAV5CDR4_ELECO|nr:hypothetical protein QOZ80_3AG0217840 [Eleusine coracana subsp. coracana]GJM96476.1 hypothetical protein PR202_ga13315 [Eleusine coracana subsp. coracana]
MAEPPTVLTLLVEKGPRMGQSLQHRAGRVLRVGRVVKGNDLAVGDAGASQRHLDLTFLPPPASRWAATDLGSSNGTLLNGAALVPTIPVPLFHGDRIKIGESTILAVSITADAGPEPAATRRSTRHAAAAAAAVEEDKAPAVRRGRRKAPAAADPPEAVKGEAEVAPRRGGRKKALSAVDPPEEGKEEAVPVTSRGGRKKAVELPEVESEEEEEVLPGESSKAPVTAPLPPQVQTTRSTRAAARRAEAVGTGQGKGEGERTRGGRGRVTRQSARKAKEAMDEEEEGELAVPGKQEGTTANSASEVEVSVALREPAERTRRGRGRAKASTRKGKDPIIEEDAEKEAEDGDVVGARECSGNPPQVIAANGGDEKEDEGTTGGGEVNEASEAEADQVVEEHGDAPLDLRDQAQIAPNGRANTRDASADKDEEGKESGREEGRDIDHESRERIVPESKSDGVGEEAEEDGKMEVSGGRGEVGVCKNVSECPAGCNLENMTLREWFVRIEEYILAKNHEAAEKAIAKVGEQHRHFIEYIKTLK